MLYPIWIGFNFKYCMDICAKSQIILILVLYITMIVIYHSKLSFQFTKFTGFLNIRRSHIDILLQLDRRSQIFLFPK
jgi:hypothetical protein